MLNKVIVTALMTGFIAQPFAEEIMAPELHIDPFVNPLSQTLEPGQDRNEELVVTEPGVGKAPRKKFLWQPELRGIIRSEDIAIANMGGEMIELGKEYEGYRLIKVKEQSVVFEKNGKQYPVPLDGTDEQEGAL